MLDNSGSLAKTLPVGDFGKFGIEELAYVKDVMVNGQICHAIHAADGTQLTIVDKRSTAFATVSQYDMQPVSVH